MDNQNLFQKELQSKTIDNDISRMQEPRTQSEEHVEDRNSESLASLSYVSSRGFFFQ